MNKKYHSLSGRYFAALSRRLKGGARGPAGLAVKCGEEAVAFGLDTLDLARIHEQSLQALAPVRCSAAELRKIRRLASQFFSRP